MHTVDEESTVSNNLHGIHFFFTLHSLQIATITKSRSVFAETGICSLNTSVFSEEDLVTGEVPMTVVVTM
jgi:hypothetical protein